MHTSDVLRSHHFRVCDASGNAASLAAGLSVDDRLGVVSPCYEAAILGAGAAILTFVTAFYDLQRARQQETGEAFFVYADYFIFLYGDGGTVRGEAGPAPLDGAVASALGWLDVWPEEKWVVVGDASDLWAQVAARGITHLLVPAHPDVELGAIPASVARGLKAAYRYLLPGEADDGGAWSIDLEAEPCEVVAEAVRRLPSESPAHDLSLATRQRIVPWGLDKDAYVA